MTYSLAFSMAVLAVLSGCTPLIEADAQPAAPLPPVTAAYHIPTIDLAHETQRQIVVDREAGQYLGHVTTVLLEDGKTMIAVYPKGHGRGGIVMKQSTDAGLTWSPRLEVPENWSTSQEVPTIHRVIDASGKKRLIMFSGLYPIRMAVSEDDGKVGTWSELKPIGNYGGIVAMGDVTRLKNGDYMALFHDDGRFLRNVATKADRSRKPVFIVYKVISKDGGLTWSEPTAIAQHPEAHLCEPGIVRSPDGKHMAVLLRENSRKCNSFVIFSSDEGRTWSTPRELPASLTGDRHTAKYAPDGRLFITFRDTTRQSPTKGDWVAWVGTWEDILHGREGQYRVRLMDNTKGADCAYPGLEILRDGTIVTTTYGHWSAGEMPYIVSVRLSLAELDARFTQPLEHVEVFRAGSEGYHTFRIPAIVRTNSNTLLAFCEGRKTGSGDHGDLDLVLKRSFDGGKTWGPLQLVYEEGGDAKVTIGNPCPVVDESTGVIWLPFCRDNDRVFVTSSKDDGKTWAKPVEITKEVKPADWTWYATGPGNAIQIRNGPHAGRMVIPCDHRVGPAKKGQGLDRAGRSHVIYSDDHGKTWKLGGVTDYGNNECAVAELEDGSLMLNMRNYVHKPSVRTVALSRDGGMTWSPSQPEAQLQVPVCQGNLLRATWRNSDGRSRMLYSGPMGNRREHMTVKLSYDEGRTWSVSRELHAGPAAYSNLVMLGDGNIGCLYERGEAKPYETISFARFSLHWLTGGKDVRP